MMEAGCVVLRRTSVHVPPHPEESRSLWHITYSFHCYTDSIFTCDLAFHLALALDMQVDVSRTEMTTDLVRAIGIKEKRLWSSHGVRIQVDSIAQDGRTLICTAFQPRKAPLLKPIDTIALVQHAETALHPLLAAGFTPMISAIDWVHGEGLRNSIGPIDAHDPIGLVSALREAGLPFPRLTRTDQPATDVVTGSFWRRALSIFAV